jgi:DNA-binding SARP family transcriptional activator
MIVLRSLFVQAGSEWRPGGVSANVDSAASRVLRVEYRLLGPVAVLHDGAPVALGGAGPRTVLARLLVDASRDASMDRLIDDVWGDGPPSTARNLVQQYVSRLRGALAAAGLAGRLLSGPSGYRLLVERGQLDLHRFEELVASADRARALGDYATVADLLRTALALWRGPALTGVASESRVRAAGIRLEEQRLAALELRIDADLRLGRDQAVVCELFELVATHPLRERLVELLMTSLHRAGRPADALRAYRTVEERLRGELGIAPGPDLQRLAASIRAHAPVLDASALPARRGRAAACQLPADLAHFCGRSEQVAALREMLIGRRSRSLRVAVVSGRAGVGKTALAVHVAHQLREEFPDGQLYAQLRGADDEPREAGEALASLLRGLGIDAVPDGLPARCELYRTEMASLRAVVLLDGAADESQVRPLLPGGESCGVLITSRSRLAGIETAQGLDVGLFTEEEALSLLAHVAGRERCSAEPEAAAGIVRLCGRLPLAIRIAGARLAVRPHWTLSEVEKRLEPEERRLDVLAVGDLNVRSSFTSGYRSLDGRERRAFRLLGLLDAPSVTACVASPLLGVPIDDAEELLERLVDLQLAEIAGHDAAGEPRYRMHDLLRLYARERAAAEEGPEVRRAALGPDHLI